MDMKVVTNARIRNNIFHLISHELKPSIVNTKGLIHLLRTESLGGEEIKELLKNLESDYVKMNVSLDNLFYSMFLFGKENYDSEKIISQIDLNKVLSEIISDFEIIISNKNIKIKDYSTTNVVLFGDKFEFTFILKSLLLVAIKEAKNNAIIELYSHCISSNLFTFSICDRRNKLSASNTPEITQTIKKSTRSNRIRDMDLSLILCQTLIKKLGGVFFIDYGVDESFDNTNEFLISISMPYRYYHYARKKVNIV